MRSTTPKIEYDPVNWTYELYGFQDMSGIKILHIEDEALIREGLQALLEKEASVSKISHAWDEATMKSAIEDIQFDVALVDIRLKNDSGINLIKYLKSIPASPFVIALTGLEGDELVINLLKLGVDGIVFKLDGYKPIWEAIGKVTNGGHYYSDRITQVIKTNAFQWDQTPPVTLNFSENELLKGIASGLTNKEIAVSLKMSPATIETYRVRLIKKLKVSNTASLIAYAYQNGLL